MGLQVTFQKGVATVFRAFGDMVKSMTLKDTDGNPYPIQAMPLDTISTGFPESIAIQYEQGLLIQGYGLAVRPAKNWTVTDHNGKLWMIGEQPKTDPAGATHMCLLIGGGA